MSIVVDPKRLYAYPAPPRRYPAWLAAQLRGENIPIPEAILAEDRPKIESYMPQVAMPGRIFGAHEDVPALYVPPAKLVSQRPMVPVKFQVLTSYDIPIVGFNIRVDDKDLLTDERGEAYTPRPTKVMLLSSLLVESLGGLFRRVPSVGCV